MKVLAAAAHSFTDNGAARMNGPRTVDIDVRESPMPLLRGASPQLCRLRDVVQRVAATEATIFLHGESGTGKECIAQTIHDLSARSEAPFVAVNCGALPMGLISSELFGHERGSFTGAARQHRGYFERAAGGTLFLDEVTEMPPEQQVNLLRVLETSRLVRVGGVAEVRTDVRIIAATNCRPKEAVADGRLREDLYYRLAEFPIYVPPLRERQGDIAHLVAYFLQLLNAAEGIYKDISPAALAALEIHHWPGNVRELKNSLQRAYILADETIEPEHFPQWHLEPRHAAPHEQLQFGVGTLLDDAERRLILATLEHFNGNKRRAADVLGISLKTIYNRLKRYGIS
jgi:DNA-binding NtrC family response regulator